MSLLPQDFAMSFLSVLFEGLPYIFIGTLISGFIDVYLPQGALDRFLPKQKGLSILVCGLLGLLIPVCECTVVPVIRRLVAKGLPVGSAFAYMLAAPIVNPITFISTWTAFENEPILMAFSRIGLGYAVAVTVGLLILLFPLEKLLKRSVIQRLNFSGHGHSLPPDLLQTPLEKTEVKKQDHHSCCDHSNKKVAPSEKKATSCCAHEHSHSTEHSACSSSATTPSKLVSALRVSVKDFVDVTVYFTVGVTLMIIFNAVTSHDSGFLAYVSSDDNLVQGTLFMMTLSFILSLCSTSDAFLVGTSFTQFGRVPKMAFLVYGPMMDAKLLFLYQTLMKKRAVMLLALVLLVLVGGLCLLWGEMIPSLQSSIELLKGGGQ